MGFIIVLLWIASSVLFYFESSSLFTVSVLMGILYLWSLGILFNYKYEYYTPMPWGFINLVTLIASPVFLLIAIF